MTANVCRALLTVFLALCLLSGATASDEFSDALMQDTCVECGSADGHLESCSLYVIPDIIDDSFDTDIPDIVEEPLNPEFSGDDLSSSDAVSSGDDPSSSDLLTGSTEPPVQLSFAEQLLASDDLWGMYSKMLSAMNEDVGILYALTADELVVLKEHANLLYLSIPEPTYEDMENWDGIIATLTVLEEKLAGTYEPVSVYANELTGNGYIYFDLSAGDVTINGNSYSGSYYDSSNSKVTISGTHSASNKYYVYQSDQNHKPTFSENTLTSVPQYNRVQSPTDSGTWGNYITNNSDVKAVVTSWNTQAGKVERTPTPHKISVSGSDTYDLTIDNLWSSYISNSQSRNTGGISFNPSGEGSSLTVNFKGDNRFGNIYYLANIGNKAQIIFDGEDDATLTVASFDGDDNYWNSVIGADDSKQESVGIVIEDGIIYAGADHGDVCTAIGGGGNGKGYVTINGGTVTAVTSSSGAAIGGGIAELSAGGEGYVVINSGFVYAYNLGYASHNLPNDKSDVKNNRIFIPSSAIGGGSSSQNTGTLGTVIIRGDAVVYAESVGGTAIGGGSSASGSGGSAVVTISGNARVTAKSVSGVVYDRYGAAFPSTPEAGAAIGGGKGKTTGGSATLTVSENAVLNTGSIGGGYGGTSTGSATVTISGGTLLGQVIMQGKDSNGNPSSFTMTGGTIDNADRAGYNFLQENGGAVWINSGEAKMSGGTIKNANAVNGGAIYVNGGSFVMSGEGTIQDCSATESGGAVYVSGGKVTISGGTIKDVSANEGGAVYVNAESTSEDSFTMFGGIIQNAEATSGNGGAVAVANGKASMKGGSIKESTASLNGGAVSVSGGSFTMSGGSIGGTDSEKCTAANGGAVAVNGGTFTMTSGIIQNSTSTEDGGAVYVSVTGTPLGDSFTMSDSASIMNCTASGNGGAICVEGGSASMSGGSIKSSTAPSGNGGAVSVSNGNFAMSGGTIGDYDAVCSAKNGGAVSVTGGTFTMSGASAVTYCNATENGGAVYVSVTGTPSVDSFTMSETSSIQNCNAVKDGGAVYVSGGSARMLNGDIEKCSAVNGGAVSVSGGNFRIDFGDVSECTASSNGGAVYVSTGNFVMDSGNLTSNTASGDGGGAYVTGGSITIGNVSCENVKVDTHVHPTTKNNEANNGGAFTVSGGTLTIYCGEYSGNKATSSNSNSIYQTNGKVYIYKGVDGNSLPLSEVLITGNTFVYTDARSTILTVTLCRSPDDTTPVSKLVDSTKYHSIRLNKSLLTDSSPIYTGTQLMGWSLNKSDTNSTVKGNPKNYYPENSKYLVTGGGNVTFYAIWGNSNDVLTYTIIIPDSFDITADGSSATVSIDTSSPFFIPDSVGRVDVKLSEFTGKLTLQNKNDQTLSYSLKKKDETELNKGSVVASFRYDKENNYKSQDVTLSAEVKDEPIYAGTYQETVTFTASVVMDEYDLDNTDDKTCYTGGTP
ncbi:MAG: hypothetical protein IJD66_03285 [Methanocorpusculum sp.]|nr:hypothetical protein [Methanocorpusculum sp.]